MWWDSTSDKTHYAKNDLIFFSKLAGGGTGFVYPNREMLLEPTKGSAAFWISTTSTMHLEPESIHGGCPVLQGNKWILNKWIYGFDQWKKYPCSLNKKETIPGFNGITP